MKKLLFAMLVFATVSCKKEAEEDVTPPSIQIISPENISEWNREDSVLIDILIEDADLHEYQITITKDDEQSYEFKAHTHQKSVKFQRSWYPFFKGIHTLTVKASDHNGNKDSKEILFTVK